MLPTLGVVEAHVADGLARPVGMGHVHGELHCPAGREDAGPVALRPLDEVLAEVDDAAAAHQLGEPPHRRQITAGKQGHFMPELKMKNQEFYD